ncbi:thiol-disulfide oxidoreductase DCC family protein [Bdellovibrio bacteriovorus]|uniref:thiol-disulfide oxidoreductase DCC family protein n=1 Tax=Bdellovibrio bacteriovorus TaxID=959 RepID=UPI003AA8AFCF
MEKQKSTSQSGITVYYDGLCQLCSREIAHYRKLKGADRIAFIDITSSDFDAISEGLDPHKIHKSLHVRDSEGKIVTGVEAFIVIWSQLESLKQIVPLASFAPVKKTLEAGYLLFAKVRPLLPRKKCSDSPYCQL